VLAAAEITRDPKRLRGAVDDDDGVDPVFVARPAVVFHGLSGAVLAGQRHADPDLTPSCVRLDVMAYDIRVTTVDDIGHVVAHRDQMFRDMGIPAEFDAMARATRQWLLNAIPSGEYRGWLGVAADGSVAAGGGLIVIPWPPGPFSMDPRCGFVFNMYTDPAHRKQGLGRRLMEAMHDWCGAQGIERVVLNASTFGQPLYEAMGYVVAEEPMMRIRL
jgi:GNAT superfamily N-acetyltransferase